MTSSARAKAERAGAVAEPLRIADPRYCPMCGILWCDLGDATAHFEEVHPELARFVRRSRPALDIPSA